MSNTEIIALVATCIGVISFALVITILYKNYIGKMLSETEDGRRDIELIDTMIYEGEEWKPGFTTRTAGRRVSPEEW